MDRKTKRFRILAILSICLLIGLGVAGTLAYLTYKTKTVTNKFTFGNVDVTIVEDFNKPNNLVVGDNVYKKSVTLKNTGTVSNFSRVNVRFSDTNVSEISYLSPNGGTSWYKVSEYKDHLPNGWAYKDDGPLSGYYYYTKALKPGESTTPLFTHVKTTFINKTADTDETINYTPRPYDIYLLSEAVQQYKLDGSGPHSSYETAWTEFLGKK